MTNLKLICVQDQAACKFYRNRIMHVKVRMLACTGYTSNMPGVGKSRPTTTFYLTRNAIVQKRCMEI